MTKTDLVDAIPHSQNAWQGWEQLSPLLQLANFYDAEPGSAFGPRYLEAFQILFVQSGQGTAEIEAQEFEIATGDLIFYGPNMRHTVTSSIEFPLRLVGLDFLFCQDDSVLMGIINAATSSEPFLFPQGEPCCPLQPFPPAKTSTAGTAKVRRYCENLVMSYKTAPDIRPLEKRALLLLLFEAWHDRWHRANSVAPLPEGQRRVLDQAEGYLRQHFINPPSTSQLAHEAGLSTDYFARLFKLHTGQSVHGFVLDLRLNRAYELLIENRLSVGEVADKVGFEDAFYFSRLFTRRFGVAPSVLRKQHQMI